MFKIGLAFLYIRPPELVWSEPRLWPKGSSAPISADDGPCVYALVRNHGSQLVRDKIVYIGLTSGPQTCFSNHPKAEEIVNRRGRTCLSIAPVDFIRGKNSIERQSDALEEIEHLLIWALWPSLENDRKMSTLPGMGTNGGDAWHILNAGYRFSGRMPREIIFPWMLVKPGRDRSAK